MSLQWHGDNVKDKVTRAAIVGVNMTVSECLREAKDLVHYDVGTLSRSIRTDGAQEVRGGIEARWGSFDVNYAFWQEVLPPERGGKAYLRPSADRHYGSLAPNIRRAMGAL